MLKRTTIAGLAAIGIAAVMLCSCHRTIKDPEIAWHLCSAGADTITGDEIDVKYLTAKGGSLADSINFYNTQALTLIIGYHAGDVQAAVDSLLTERNNDGMTSQMPYTVMVDGSTNRYVNIFSVMLSSYTYMGGSHGNSAEIYYNFDMRDGRKLAIADLISDTVTLKRLNRAAFTQAYDDLEDVESMLFVTLDNLPLAENFWIDADGLNVCYNQYEIAPYAFGQIDYTIPMEQIGLLLNRDLLGKMK